MKLLFLLATLVVLATGCKDVRRETSDVLSEPATVVQPIYSPRVHDTSLDLGFTSGGNISVTPTSINVPEQYGVVFECLHGHFAVVGPDEKDKNLFLQFRPGAEVTVYYYEVYDVEYKDGEPVHRKLVDYDFLRAEPRE
jgi:hypothetical protein